jgi:hypothetical protein
MFHAALFLWSRSTRIALSCIPFIIGCVTLWSLGCSSLRCGQLHKQMESCVGFSLITSQVITALCRGCLATINNSSNSREVTEWATLSSEPQHLSLSRTVFIIFLSRLRPNVILFPAITSATTINTLTITRPLLLLLLLLIMTRMHGI